MAIWNNPKVKDLAVFKSGGKVHCSKCGTVIPKGIPYLGLMQTKKVVIRWQHGMPTTPATDQDISSNKIKICPVCFDSYVEEIMAFKKTQAYEDFKMERFAFFLEKGDNTHRN